MKYLIEYLDAIWLSPGYFDSAEDAWTFIRNNSDDMGYPGLRYKVIPVSQGHESDIPPLPKGGVRMYRVPSGRNGTL